MPRQISGEYGKVFCINMERTDCGKTFRLRFLKEKRGKGKKGLAWGYKGWTGVGIGVEIGKGVQKTLLGRPPIDGENRWGKGGKYCRKVEQRKKKKKYWGRACRTLQWVPGVRRKRNEGTGRY